MTTAGERFEDGRLDRLVDGELSDAEYRELLRTLEQRPGGWRACALAFLEAQAWRRELGEAVDASPARERGFHSHAKRQRGDVPGPALALRASVTDDRGQLGPAARPLRPASHSWTALLTLAASFLLVFALGVAFHAQWPLLGPAPTNPQVAEESLPAPREADRQSVPGEDRRGPADHSGAPGGNRQMLAGEDRRGPAAHTAAPSGNLRVLVGDGGGSGAQAVEVPLYEWAPGMLPQPTQVPPDVQRALQRMGRQLRWERHFVPLNLEGGRRALLPVEQLEVTPVEHGLYQ